MDAVSDRVKVYAEKSIRFITEHRNVLVFVLASAAVITAIIQANAYLNPSRNETLYEEQRLQINYSEINQDVVSKLQSTLEDRDITVDPSFVPNRSNPFTE